MEHVRLALVSCVVLTVYCSRAFGNPRGLEADNEEELVELGEEAGEIMDARERRKRARAATRAAGSPEV